MAHAQPVMDLLGALGDEAGQPIPIADSESPRNQVSDIAQITGDIPDNIPLFDQVWLDVGQIWHDLGQTWPGIVQTSPSFDQTWPQISETRPGFAWNRPNVPEFGPSIDWPGVIQTWPEFDRIWPEIDQI